MSKADDWSFGSLAWNEYYFGRNNSKKMPTTERAHRSRTQYTPSALKAYDRVRAEEARKIAEQLEQEEAAFLASFDAWPTF